MKYYYFTLLILVLGLSACSPNTNFELYEGKSLRIAVIGEPPEVKEEQVRFDAVSFDEITSEGIGSYDAVLITEENLNKAAESQYAEVYLNSTIPFFFISTKSHIPFTLKDTVYDNTWNWTAGDYYAVGVLTSQEDDALKSWGYGLYNDKKTDEHIEEVYSRIFKTIDELNL
ncbi:hypothetical protein [Bacillus sp. MRMR6]|uniref:hypothetical protein n=1 Tax=Bacillus sp. MRMR6 TaxID=1928617 RepID=UPI0009511EE6|nr:hypothetical protein [Bacillus sp. MRMR6]OLS33424.1 hypothetical protein BTR25_25905 [Bacillus sp. MRMR6]